jgi:hypothetical protein
MQTWKRLSLRVDDKHRAAVRERLVDQEADLSRLPRLAVGRAVDPSRRAVDGLRKLNLGRDQILARLWELANLSHEVTRGSIAGQIKALSMIAAIEGLIPDRRFSPSETQPTAPPVDAQFYTSQWRRKEQDQAAGEEPGDPVAGTKTTPAAPQVPHPEPAPEPRLEPAAARANHTSSPNLDLPQPRPANPFINSKSLNWVPAATECVVDAVPDKAHPARLSFSPDKRFSGRRR